MVHRVAADRVLRAGRHVAGRGDVRQGTSSTLRAPAHVRLMAARLYWGPRPPSYPSTARMHRDLSRTAHYFAHVSRGRQHVRVTLTRWVHVSVSGDVMCNTQRRSVRAAGAALRRAGYHPGRFNRLMIFTEQCNAAASAAQLPGRVSWIRFRAPGMATLVHELGHNLGLEHAYGVVCRHDGRRVALAGSGESGTCLPVEYGDSWDAMGHSTGFYSVPALVRLGWAGKIQSVHRSGTYALADVARARTANQALRIRVGCHDVLGGVPARAQPAGRPHHPGRDDPAAGRSWAGRDDRRLAGQPDGHRLPRRRPHQLRAPGREQPDHAGGHPVHHGRDGAARQGAGQLRPDGDRPGRTGRRRRRPGPRRLPRRWTVPADNGQIVLGYRVTAEPSGVSTFVRSPAGYRTTARFSLSKLGPTPPTFTVRALNQDGWSAMSPGDPPPDAPVPARSTGTQRDLN